MLATAPAMGTRLYQQTRALPKSSLLAIFLPSLLSHHEIIEMR
jgi:hypothetical protein